MWIGWIKKIVEGGSVSILLNGTECNSFKVGKGLGQGDPISPLLFNLVGDVLTKMLKKALESGLVKGILGEEREGGVMSLQYADDTLIFFSADELHLKNLKGVLLWFEQISGM